MQVIPLRMETPSQMLFSPDGRYLATTDRETAAIDVWDGTMGQLLNWDRFGGTPWRLLDFIATPTGWTLIAQRASGAAYVLPIAAAAILPERPCPSLAWEDCLCDASDANAISLFRSDSLVDTQSVTLSVIDSLRSAEVLHTIVHQDSIRIDDREDATFHERWAHQLPPALCPIRLHLPHHRESLAALLEERIADAPHRFQNHLLVLEKDSGATQHTLTLDRRPRDIPSRIAVGDRCARAAFQTHATTLGIWDLDSGRQTDEVTENARLNAFDFHPHGPLLALAWENGCADLYDTDSNSRCARFAWGVGPLREIRFAPDGLRCAALAKSGELILWDVEG